MPSYPISSNVDVVSKFNEYALKAITYKKESNKHESDKISSILPELTKLFRPNSRTILWLLVMIICGCMIYPYIIAIKTMIDVSNDKIKIDSEIFWVSVCILPVGLIMIIMMICVTVQYF